MGRKLLQKLRTGQDAKITLAGALLLILAAFCGATLLGIDTPSSEEKAKTDRGTQTAVETAAAVDADSAVAAEEAPAKASNKRLAPPRASVGSAGRMVTGLFFVLVLGAGGLLFGRKFLKKVRMSPKGDRVLQVVDAIPLGGKRQVYVLEIYGRRIVVGATPDSLSTLSEFEADELADESTIEELAQSTPAPSAIAVAPSAKKIATSKAPAPAAATTTSTPKVAPAASKVPETPAASAEASAALAPGVLPKDFEDLIRRKTAGIRSLEIEA